MNYIVQLQLNNCPAGFARVGYQVVPLDGAVDAVPGTIKLRPGSSATGVGIQLYDATSGQPLPFQKSQAVTAYNSSTGGSATVPLFAAYAQTDSRVGGGSVQAAVSILLDYQ